MALWTTFFLEFWKRKEKWFALQWGMHGFEEQEQPRPDFSGEMIPSPINGQPIRYYPSSKRFMKQLVGQLVILFMTFIVFICVFSIFVLRIYLVGIDFPMAKTVASVINAVQIQIMNRIFGTIANTLNNWENHETETEYYDNLIAKTFLFQFVNSYTSLFYVAFLKKNFKFGKFSDGCDGSCLDELKTQLEGLIVTSALIGNFQELVIPTLIGWYKSLKDDDDDEEEEFAQNHSDSDSDGEPKVQVKPVFDQEVEIFLNRIL